MRKTAMQLLIDIIKSSKQEVDVQGVGICEVLDYHRIKDKATKLLEMEWEQIEETYDEGYKDAEADMQQHKQTCGFCVNKKSLHLSP